jgi:hypothetical protein
MSSRPTARSSIRAPADLSEGRAGPAAHSAAEIADELSAWAVGGGIITAAVFPLALPILALTGVAMLPFVVVPLAVALAALLVALPALTVRSLVRRAHAMAGTARAAGQAPAPAQRGG